MTLPALADAYVCEDGTEFAVYSELVRGEPRFYWVMRRDPGTPGAHEVDSDGSYDRRSAQRAARRLAVGHDQANR